MSILAMERVASQILIVVTAANNKFAQAGASECLGVWQLAGLFNLAI
jgi:hypothetical protein